MKAKNILFRPGSTGKTETSPNGKKGSGSVRIAKPEDDLFLAVLSWLHILLICAGLYLLTILACDMEIPGEAAAGAVKAPAPAGLLVRSLWLLVPLALGWVFIRVIRSIVIYLLCSCAVCALLAGLTHSALTTALAAALLALRCYARLKRGKIRRILAEMPGEAGGQLSAELWEIPTFLDRPSPAHWGVFAFYYAVFLIAGQDRLLSYVFYLLLADVFVCFLFGYLDNMARFIRDNRRIANLPVHSIRKIGRILLFVSLILLVLIVLPAVLYGREPLTALRARIKPVELTPSTEMEELMRDGVFGADFGMLPDAPSEPPAWMTALGNLLFYLGAIAVAAAALVVVYRLCRNALSYFAQDEDDEIIFLGTEEASGSRAKARRTRAKKERRNSPNQRIRRQYRQTILHAMRERPEAGQAASEPKTPAGQKRAGGWTAAVQAGLTGKKTPAGWETPAELETKAELARDESTDKLHTLYEKARYSREGCTEEDAKALR